jgi:Kef-type K+ transport system membrane component KefB
VILFGLVPAVAVADTGHSDSVAPVLLSLAVVLIAGKLGGEISVRLGQPAVLGEIGAGILLGALYRAGLPLPDIASNPTMDTLARIGVVLLMFEVGLESTVKQMLAVGVRATLVAATGVIAPIAMWACVGSVLVPGQPLIKHVFVGAALCATSVGITARVLREIGALQSEEGRVILGAAVVDDVMGLVVLTFLTGLLAASGRGEAFSLIVPVKVVVYATTFLTATIILGPIVSKYVFHLSHRLRSSEVLLPVALSFGFLLSVLANAVDLAPIVGAYGAGLVLEQSHYEPLLKRGEYRLEQLVRPIGQMLVPVFFVVMGARVNLGAYASGGAWLFTLLLIVVAVISKLTCGLAASRGSNRWAVGLGMVPRGEVGLIFADAGQRTLMGGVPLLSNGEFAAIVLVVLVSTVATPPLLTWSLRRRSSANALTGAVGTAGALAGD